MYRYKQFILHNRLYINILVVVILVFGLQSIAETYGMKNLESKQNIDDKITMELFTSKINIPQGSSAVEISGILKDSYLIDSAYAFELYVRNENLTDRLRAGEYEINSGLSYEEIVNILLIGPPLQTYQITIIEGLWIEEVIDSISIQTGFDSIELINSLTSGLVKSKYLDEFESSELQNWEGLLYPNTYKLSVDAQGEEVLQILVDELEAVIENLKSDNTTPSWINNDYEIFIIARLIESESKLDEDRPLVASVIKNRNKIGMPLQIDATILYSLQERRNRVLLKDLQVESEYNTYKNEGLPPTPIGNFGQKSIAAVFEDLNNNFIYYLLTDTNGDMSFTNDYQEFLDLKNKAKEEGVIP